MLRLIFFAPVFILNTVIFAFMAMVGGIFNPYSAFNTGVMRIWARISLIAAGVKLELIGLENVQAGTSYVIVANHQSHIDIPVMMKAIPSPFRIISKKELFKIPVFGWGMRAAGILEIDRSNQKKSIETLKKAEAVLQSHQLSILAFPEGTRSPDGKIHLFKKGPFMLAINAGLPVLPVSVSGTRKILPKGKMRMAGGRVRVQIHPPIYHSVSNPTDRDLLMEETHRTITDGFLENY